MPQTQFTLRRGVATDQTSLEACMEGNTDVMKPENIRKQARNCLSRCKVIVAVAPNGGIAGFVAYKIAAAEPPQPAHVYIQRLFVHRYYQRQGLGKRLLQQVFDEARTRGLPIAVHAVGDAAQTMFRAHGFQYYAYKDSPGYQKGYEHWLWNIPPAGNAASMRGTARNLTRSPVRQSSASPSNRRQLS